MQPAIQILRTLRWKLPGEPNLKKTRADSLFPVVTGGSKSLLFEKIPCIFPR